MTAPAVAAPAPAAAAGTGAAAGSAVDPALVLAGLEAYTAATADVRARLVNGLTGMWDRLPTLRQPDGFLDTAIPRVQGGQRAMAALTSAYMAGFHRAVTGAATPPPVAITPGALRDGVTPDEIYRRPFVTAYTALSRGADIETAQRMGRNRLESLIATDLQLAKTHQSQASMTALGISGYRRVLVGNKNCGLCVLASTRRYHVSTLMPIHPGCDCAVAPIHGHVDPGAAIDAMYLRDDAEPDPTDAVHAASVNPDDLVDEGDLAPAVHAAITERFGPDAVNASGKGGLSGIDYRQVMTVRHHGEIGPVLTVADQQFTGPSDIK